MNSNPSVSSWILVGLAAAFAASYSVAQTPVGQQIAEAELRVQEALDDLAGLRRSLQEASEASEAAEAEDQTVEFAEPDEEITDPIERIRREGLERSQVMETISYLTDVIGPRLTGSPNLRRANEWTRDTLESWGLANAKLEPWGPFGRGWSIESFSVQVVEPYAIPLTGYPNAWTPGLEAPISRPALRLTVPTRADLENYIGELDGKIVLMGRPSDVEAHFEPQAARRTEAQLQELADSVGRRGGPGRRGGAGRGGPGGGGAGRGGGEEVDPLTQPVPLTEGIAFAIREGAAAVLITSTQGDGGTLFAQSAVRPFAGRGGGGADVWDLEPPELSPQVTLAREDYNRLVRMLDQGAELEIALDLKVQFHEDDLMGYNTVAEIPGSDLSHEVVMLGGHLDSWHVGTGATDNAAGVAAAMEAVRIIQALQLQPRRTIRIALWTGEEQGLIGSEQYVTQNFGYFANAPAATGRGGPGQGGNGRGGRGGRGRTLVELDEYDNFSAYFNLDNGTGRIRGVYMQGNEGVRPVFREWLAPFGDLGAETLTINSVGGTDHTSFDAIGLPAFQFIQDPIEYSSRTHHSTADVYDRIQEEDIKQAATIMAAFVYQAAMMDEKLPRKPAP